MALVTEADIGVLEAFLLTPPLPSPDGFRRWVRKQPPEGIWPEIFLSGEQQTFHERTLAAYKTVSLHHYSAYRRKQVENASFPLLIYRSSPECEDHAFLDRLILRRDHPAWQAIRPPNGLDCGCRAYGSHSHDGARRRGGDPDIALPIELSTAEGLAAWAARNQTPTFESLLASWGHTVRA